MDGIEKVILKIFNRQEDKNKYYLHNMQCKWKEICGVAVAKHSKPIKIERRVLYINTDSSVWSHHLLVMKKQFIENINKFFRYEIIKDLRFLSGNVIFTEMKNEVECEKIQFLPLTEKEENSVIEAVKTVKNEKLQQRLAKFKALSLQRNKALQQANFKLCSVCGNIALEDEILCRRSDEKLAILKKDFTYSYEKRIDEENSAVRFCTSWATKEEDVKKLLDTIKML